MVMAKTTSAAASQTMGGALSIRGVSKVHHAVDGREVVALSEVNLDLAPGEFVSLVGPSGCGKTTLLRLIAGLDEPTAGQLLVDEQAIDGPSAERGLVFQDATLFPWLSVKRNIQTGLVARGLRRQKGADVEAFIRLVGLQGFESSYSCQ